MKQRHLDPRRLEPARAIVRRCDRVHRTQRCAARRPRRDAGPAVFAHQTDRAVGTLGDFDLLDGTFDFHVVLREQPDCGKRRAVGDTARRAVAVHIGSRVALGGHGAAERSREQRRERRECRSAVGQLPVRRCFAAVNVSNKRTTCRRR